MGCRGLRSVRSSSVHSCTTASRSCAPVTCTYTWTHGKQTISSAATSTGAHHKAEHLKEPCTDHRAQTWWCLSTTMMTALGQAVLQAGEMLSAAQHGLSAASVAMISLAFSRGLTGTARTFGAAMWSCDVLRGSPGCYPCCCDCCCCVALACCYGLGAGAVRSRSRRPGPDSSSIPQPPSDRSAPAITQSSSKHTQIHACKH